jgi:hypothetical protein
VLAFPSSPVAGQHFQKWMWDGVKWTPTKADRAPHCGRMQLPPGQANSNTMMLLPRNGDEIKIGGWIYKIPAAGVSAVANACYVDKVMGAISPGQWFVYAFMHPTAGMQLSFSRTGHVMSTVAGNVGTEVRSGDDAQTLVGIIEASGAAPNNPSFHDDYTYRHTRSWFNRRRSVAFAVANGVSVSVAAYTILNTVFIVGFADDVLVVYGQFMATSNANCNLTPILYQNSVSIGANAACSTPYTSGKYVKTMSHAAVPSVEGRSILQHGVYVTYTATAGGNAGLFATLTGGDPS